MSDGGIVLAIHQHTQITSGLVLRALAITAIAASMLIAMLVLPGRADAWAPRPKIDATEMAQVRLINRYRAAHRLPTLRIDRKLSATAEWMGADMPRHSYFGHRDSMRRDPFRRLVAFKYPTNSWRGENLAAGYPDARRTFIQWRNSRGHRANMLNRNYRAIGVARVCKFRSRYNCYWVTEFGSKYTARV